MICNIFKTAVEFNAVVIIRDVSRASLAPRKGTSRTEHMIRYALIEDMGYARRVTFYDVPDDIMLNR